MIKLVSLNIEREKHLELVVPFLQKEAADVVCIQELREKDIPQLGAMLGSFAYAPTLRHRSDFTSVIGNAIFSKVPIERKSIRYYVGSAEEEVPKEELPVKGANHALVLLDIQKGGRSYRIGCTHFTWTPHGEATDLQRSDMASLLAILEASGELVLAGDFNAPRGGEIFSLLAKRYKDNIPPEYKTSIDVNLHRLGKEHPDEFTDKMVDGLFSTPNYIVSDVELHSGVSDHFAITATVAKAESE